MGVTDQSIIDAFSERLDITGLSAVIDWRYEKCQGVEAIALAVCHKIKKCFDPISYLLRQFTRRV